MGDVDLRGSSDDMIRIHLGLIDVRSLIVSVSESSSNEQTSVEECLKKEEEEEESKAGIQLFSGK